MSIRIDSFKSLCASQLLQQLLQYLVFFYSCTDANDLARKDLVACMHKTTHYGEYSSRINGECNLQLKMYVASLFIV